MPKNQFLARGIARIGQSPDENIQDVGAHARD